MIEEGHTNGTADTQYLVRFIPIHPNHDLGLIGDADLLLGLFTPQRTHVSLHIGEYHITNIETVAMQFQPLITNGTCLPLPSLASHRIFINFDSAIVYGIYGYIGDFHARLRLLTNTWKLIDGANNIVLVKCPEQMITRADHLCHFDEIDSLPQITKYIDEAYEAWRREKCHAFVDVILKELIERTWHPSRHIEWCLDEDDKRMLGLSHDNLVK